MNDSVVEVRDFRKVYGDFVAIDGISFEVKAGEIYVIMPQLYLAVLQSKN